MMMMMMMMMMMYVKMVPCPQGMMRPQVADGEDGLDIQTADVIMLNNKLRTADKGWSYNFGQVCREK
jgi:hypothetical protein